LVELLGEFFYRHFRTAGNFKAEWKRMSAISNKRQKLLGHR
jgi:hypothetical protein